MVKNNDLLNKSCVGLETFSLPDMTYIISDLETMKIKELYCTQRRTVNYLFVIELTRLVIIFLAIIYSASSLSSFMNKLKLLLHQQLVCSIKPS